MQPHAVAAEDVRGRCTVEKFTPDLHEADLAVRVVERVAATTGGVSLAEAKVVVSAGRGAGSPEGFAIIEELADLLGGAWLLASGDDGRLATAHGPGRADRDEDRARDLHRVRHLGGDAAHGRLQGRAKALLAINTDAEAPILASADYAVIGDLHEVVPAISAELRKARA